MPQRELDIVLFGATGFVGRLTAAHLAEHAPEGTRIALAGRSQARLEEVRATLPGAARDWPVVVADARDRGAMDALAARTTVVATTVGPYAKYGTALVAACAAAGTHYADLTGEVLFVKRMIDAHDATAKRTGARIVHGCGFDSIPSDLGVFLTARTAADDGAGPLGPTRLAVRSLRGGFSGGTIDSARVQAAEMTADKSARATAADPWALAEGGRPPRSSGMPSAAPTSPIPLGPLEPLVGPVLAKAVKASPVRRDPDNGHFTGPFVMAAYNTRIVARSASILHYGPRFRYVEYQDMGAGPKGAAVAAGVSAGLLAGLAGLAFGPTRAVLDKVLPKPGEGPSAEAMAKGRFRMEINTTAGPDDTGAHTAYRTIVGAPYDPGYSGTAIMLGQSALALALDGAALPAGEAATGVVTPAVALGMPLVERLRGFRFVFDCTRLP